MSYEKCEHEGCEVAAQFAPKVFVPPRGYSAEEKHSLQAILGIKYCLAHAKAFDAKEQFKNKETGETWRDIFHFMVRAAGSSIPPDFKRAWSKPIALDSQEYLTFERLQSSQH